MEFDIFKEKDLRLSDYQFTICWHKTTDFTIGEIVFLKSNPDFPMVVYKINDKEIITKYYNKCGYIQYSSFPPECILQYDYACLVTFRKTFELSLN